MGTPRSVATKQNSFRSLENDAKPSTSSIVSPASSTARRIVSSASWYSVQRASFPHLVYSDSAMPTIAAVSFIGTSPDQPRRAEASPLVRVDAGGGQHLLGVLAEERWPPCETPRARGGNERPAGVEELPVELGMAHRDPEAAIVEVGVVEVLVGGPDRGPRKSLTLTRTVDLVGAVAGAIRLERGPHQRVEAGTVPGRLAQRPIETVRRQQLEEAGNHVRTEKLGDDRAHPDAVAGPELLPEDGARAHLPGEDVLRDVPFRDAGGRLVHRDLHVLPAPVARASNDGAEE